MTVQLTPYSALIDASTHAVLMLSARAQMISVLAQGDSDTEYAMSVNYPNYLREFPLAKLEPPAWPEHTWSAMDRRFAPTPSQALTDELRRRALLAAKKGYVLSEVTRALCDARSHVMTGVAMQEIVYVTKKLQAQRYKDAGYPANVTIQAPYVLQYAEFAGLTMRQAADEILFKANLHDELLLQTELFRLRYFKLIKEAKEVALIDRILVQFYREFLWVDT